MLSAILMNVIMLSVIILNVIMLSVILLNVIMLSVILVNVIMLSVIILIVAMLSVVASSQRLSKRLHVFLSKAKWPTDILRFFASSRLELKKNFVDQMLVGQMLSAK